MKKSMSIFFTFFLALGCNSDSLLSPDMDGDLDSNPILEEEAPGKVSFMITDAPVDNAEVKSVFLTISEIRLDGESIEGLMPTTVDLLAYQNGDALDMGSYTIDANSYSQVELILDFEDNASRTGRGAYLETHDGEIHPLSLSSNKLTFSHKVVVEGNNASSVIFDVDLRKSITAETKSNGEVSYGLVSKEEMETAIRILDPETSSVVKGRYTATYGNDDIIVAYIYRSGQFDPSIELSGQGDNQILFSKAVNSTSCSSNGEFELHFIEKGYYEVYFASYSRSSDGKVRFEGMYSTGGGLNLLEPVSLTVLSKSTVEVDVTLYKVFYT